MTKAQRPIDPVDFSAIARTKDLINSFPPEVLICPEHQEPVMISESDFALDPGAGPPFGKAAYVGCCDAAIDRVIDAIMRKGPNVYLALAMPNKSLDASGGSASRN